MLSMKNKITILPQDLVNKIAAGEVVERPASVVKELLENSIDAGSKSIKIKIKSGGVKLIEVTDDGEGMSQKDAELCLERHATSKISQKDDLYNISTLGFRGEALPSIASVCFLELMTKKKGDLSGICLNLEAGKIKEKKETGAPVGTSVTVKELFYNTPARRKFLKSKLTETKHIIDFVQNYALAYPQVSFELESDNKILLNLPPSNLKQRIADIWGKDLSSKLVEMEKEKSDPEIFGFLCKPELTRSNRSEIRIFVNQRPVVSRALNHAIQSGYGDLLPQGKFPIAFAFFEIEPKTIDVNVHPTKREVKFSNEHQIYNLLYLKVKKSLKSFQTIAVYDISSEKFVSEGAGKNIVGETTKVYKTKMEKPDYVQEKIVDEIFFAKEEKKKEFDEKKELGNLWQVFDQYILVQNENELWIIDQHAAHERILYEEISQNIDKNLLLSQKLLFPETIELSPKEFLTYQENSDLLQKIGFEIEPFGKNSILISGVPSLSKSRSEKELFCELLSELDQNQKKQDDRIKRIAQAFACKASIKAGQRLSYQEIKRLYQNLLSTNNPFSCPHGRPTVVRISLEELDKKFMRNILRKRS